MRSHFAQWMCLAVLLLSALHPGSDSAQASPSRPPLSDVRGHWAEHSIMTAVASGWASGYPDGTFRPDAPATRAEAISLIVKALVAAHMMTPVPTGYTYLGVDVDTATQSHWAVRTGLIPTAVATGLVPLKELKQGGSVNLNAHATRLEASVWLARAAHPELDAYLLFHSLRTGPMWSDADRQAMIPPGSRGPWPFQDRVPPDKTPYVLMAYDAGLIRGLPDGTFQGDKPVTRAELVAMLTRLHPVANPWSPGSPNLQAPPEHPGHGPVAEVRWDRPGGIGTLAPRPLRGDRTRDWPAIRRLLRALGQASPDIPPRELVTQIMVASNPGRYLKIEYADGFVHEIEPLLLCMYVEDSVSKTVSCSPEPGWMFFEGREWHAPDLWHEFVGQLHFDMPELLQMDS